MGSYLWRKFVHADEKAQRGTLNEASCGRWQKFTKAHRPRHVELSRDVVRLLRTLLEDAESYVILSSEQEKAVERFYGHSILHTRRGGESRGSG